MQQPGCWGLLAVCLRCSTTPVFMPASQREGGVEEGFARHVFRHSDSNTPWHPFFPSLSLLIPPSLGGLSKLLWELESVDSFSSSLFPSIFSVLHSLHYRSNVLKSLGADGKKKSEEWGREMVCIFRFDTCVKKMAKAVSRPICLRSLMP